MSKPKRAPIRFKKSPNEFTLQRLTNHLHGIVTTAGKLQQSKKVVPLADVIKLLELIGKAGYISIVNCRNPLGHWGNDKNTIWIEDVILPQYEEFNVSPPEEKKHS